MTALSEIELEFQVTEFTCWLKPPGSREWLESPRNL